jgi:flagellin-specific chaperone FliS
MAMKFKISGDLKNQLALYGAKLERLDQSKKVIDETWIELRKREQVEVIEDYLMALEDELNVETKQLVIKFLQKLYKYAQKQPRRK